MAVVDRSPDHPDIRVKRIYDAPETADGRRVLVDRLWPRGLAKADAHIDLWLAAVAPSTALRRRFHSGGLDWPGFRAAYGAELAAAAWAEPVQTLRRLAAEGPLTLLFAARDQAQNHALVLRDHLAAQGRIGAGTDD
jgi:uncharacterized protein YeaO (DUF488 family)